MNGTKMVFSKKQRFCFSKFQSVSNKANAIKSASLQKSFSSLQQNFLPKYYYIFISVSMSASLSHYFSICLSQSVCLCQYVFLCLPVSVYPSLSVCLTLYICLFLSFSLCLSVNISLNLNPHKTSRLDR